MCIKWPIWSVVRASHCSYISWIHGIPGQVEQVEEATCPGHICPDLNLAFFCSNCRKFAKSTYPT